MMMMMMKMLTSLLFSLSCCSAFITLLMASSSWSWASRHCFRLPLAATSDAILTGNRKQCYNKQVGLEFNGKERQVMMSLRCDENSCSSINNYGASLRNFMKTSARGNVLFCFLFPLVFTSAFLLNSHQPICFLSSPIHSVFNLIRHKLLLHIRFYR